MANRLRLSPNLSLRPLLRVHKIRLDPNQAQANHFAQACGVARFAWNWALAEWQRQYLAHRADSTLPAPSEGALRRQLNAIKRAEYPWMLDVTKCAPQEAIRALGVAYKNWFASLSGKRKGPKIGAPQFKKKFKSKDSFKFDEKFAVDGCRIRIPNLGWVRMRESLRFQGALKGATVSRTADAWFVAILVDVEERPSCSPDDVRRSKSHAAVGVDFGIKALATFSDGSQAVEGPRALGALLQRLRRLSRAHGRKVKGSANRRKSAQRLARLHARIANVRADALHKLSHRLTRDYAFIAIEDLNVKGMLGNRRLARHIADAGFGELRRQLTYKAAWRGVHLEVVDRWFPSSKTCSACGALNGTLTLSDRRWVCEACGTEHERDENAAKNILAEALRQIEHGTEGVSGIVCGEGGAGNSYTVAKLPSVKQKDKAYPDHQVI